MHLLFFFLISFIRSLPVFLVFFFFKDAALGLRCCMRAFSSCSELGLLFVAVCGLLIAVASRCGAWTLGAWASVVVARGLSSCGLRALESWFSSCGAWAQERRLSSCGTRA